MPSTLDALVLELGLDSKKLNEGMRARAVVAEGDVIDHGEHEYYHRMNALKAAEWKLIGTPAKGIVEIRERALAVEHVFGMADWMGEPPDGRRRAMLSALISDVLSPTAED
jgi:hypothetical protein